MANVVYYVLHARLCFGCTSPFPLHSVLSQGVRVFSNAQVKFVNAVAVTMLAAVSFISVLSLLVAIKM